ncbi:MAG TPA: CxxC-x17-CxxC domain-containing protein [Candidatus Heimdallarchaeota archaeon]|nr:CxxC-x17-CxxC domain-containing protein [Candidatus Heimdallarchaeota archaeon]
MSVGPTGSNGCCGKVLEGELMASGRKMHDVRVFDLKCAECGTKIEELPFLPLTDRPVYCVECTSKRPPTKKGNKKKSRPSHGRPKGRRRR